MLFCRSALLLAVAGLCFSQTFENTVQPVLSKTCANCHNDQLASGGLNIAGFTKVSSLTADRAGWDRILDKLRAGETPPKPMPRPKELGVVIQFVQGELDKADRNSRVDPGRVTARRLS